MRGLCLIMSTFKVSVEKKGSGIIAVMDKFGLYPAEYNPKVHGPYHPGRYYGKPDASLGEVKLGELGSWLSRRNYSPQGLAQAIHRGTWRWGARWIMPQKASLAGVMQACFAIATAYYFLQYRAHTNHRHAKYH